MATVTLGSKAEGSIIKLKENGVLVDFYIAKQNYESGLNGAAQKAVFFPLEKRGLHHDK